jgi:broad specificity phosphatase PhoE
MRHAERPEILPGETGDDLSITAAGAERARALGASLGAAVASLSSSPVRRCMETAAAIAEGAAVALPVVRDRLLGDPGAFVADAAAAWQNWQRFGHAGVIERLVAGVEGLPGMRSPGGAARLLMEHLAARLPGGPTGHRVHIFVTHDAVLAPFVAHMSGAALAAPEWPDFLEWAAIRRGADGLRLAYRGRSQRVVDPS